MKKYGISSFDVNYIQKKINLQKEYQESFTFTTSSGAVKTLADVSLSANLSARYYAQLVNKVNTLQQLMTNTNLFPVFLTITLDGWLHNLHYGDYSSFTNDDEESNQNFYNYLPENDKYGYLKTKALNRESFEVNDLYKVIRYQWERFTKTHYFLQMRKSHKIGYLFATEPHLSGVPHCHVLLYIPSDYIQKIKNDFARIFNAPMNISQDSSRLSPEQIRNGELNGFQWTISNPVGYILKYVTKSFMDIKNQTDIDELQAWYIKHRIVRFTTSHTLVPQWVYSKAYPLENDWLYLTEVKNNSFCEWSKEDNYFKFEDYNLSKTLIFNNGLYQMFQNGELIREFGEIKKPVVLEQSMKFKPKFSFKKKTRFIPVDINGKKYFLYKNNLIEDIPVFQPTLAKDYQLLRYFYNLELKDINTINLQHYGLVKNECIKRKLIDSELVSLNDYNSNFIT